MAGRDESPDQYDEPQARDTERLLLEDEKHLEEIGIDSGNGEPLTEETEAREEEEDYDVLASDAYAKKCEEDLEDPLTRLFRKYRDRKYEDNGNG